MFISCFKCVLKEIKTYRKNEPAQQQQQQQGPSHEAGLDGELFIFQKGLFLIF